MGFTSPEYAALSTWAACPTACARVVAVEVRGPEAQVVIDTVPSYPDYVRCVLTDDGWTVTSSGNGSSVGWSEWTGPG